ncbi:MAG: YbbR-like domain-containing protein, partial [Firmicutes bacterium]|nr:YbbR-like domain-containing protein [Bacillota bacterium]
KVAELVLKDENGDTVNYSRDVIRTSVNDVSVYVPIYTYKTIRVQPYVVGDVPAGYEYVSLEQDVLQVDVYGQESALNKINNLSLPEIDISNATNTFTQRFYFQRVLDEKFGENVVRLLRGDGTSDSVLITINVEEQVERTISFPTSQIVVSGLSSDYEYSFDKDTVDIVIYGIKESVDYFDGENMVVMLRLKAADLKPGSQTVILDITGLGSVKVREAKATITLKQVQQDEESDNAAQQENSESSSTTEESSS